MLLLFQFYKFFHQNCTGFKTQIFTNSVDFSPILSILLQFYHFQANFVGFTQFQSIFVRIQQFLRKFSCFKSNRTAETHSIDFPLIPLHLYMNSTYRILMRILSYFNVNFITYFCRIFKANSIGCFKQILSDVSSKFRQILFELTSKFFFVRVWVKIISRSGFPITNNPRGAPCEYLFMDVVIPSFQFVFRTGHGSPDSLNTNPAEDKLRYVTKIVNRYIADSR